MWAIKSKGLDGAVDMRPRRIDSSYDPTIEARCRGEASEEKDVLRDLRKAGVGGECGC